MKKKFDWDLVEWADILQRSLSAQANVCGGGGGGTDANTDLRKTANFCSQGLKMCSAMQSLLGCVYTQIEPYQEVKI